MVLKKVRGYNRCRQNARQMSNRELAEAIRILRAEEYHMYTDERACYEALEDEAVDRLVESF